MKDEKINYEAIYEKHNAFMEELKRLKLALVRDISRAKKGT
jgi:hypothetical protein